jgi:hypothetical protein
VASPALRGRRYSKVTQHRIPRSLSGRFANVARVRRAPQRPLTRPRSGWLKAPAAGHSFASLQGRLSPRGRGLGFQNFSPAAHTTPRLDHPQKLFAQIQATEFGRQPHRSQLSERSHGSHRPEQRCGRAKSLIKTFGGEAPGSHRHNKVRARGLVVYSDQTGVYSEPPEGQKTNSS